MWNNCLRAQLAALRSFLVSTATFSGLTSAGELAYTATKGFSNLAAYRRLSRILRSLRLWRVNNALQRIYYMGKLNQLAYFTDKPKMLA
ncbi:MAG: hypothetical protein Q7U33_03545 [Methylotenera sp.]|uniref:hypothetical protein n=1 Tax=Methylotenera sp. TaxID=2051956 RepID=UPI002727686F|nr:hypothetical protein [Methylotenera sp.]MDO9150433.1 hypothetical protein [Methylotenera sp.]